MYNLRINHFVEIILATNFILFVIVIQRDQKHLQQEYDDLKAKYVCGLYTS